MKKTFLSALFLAAASTALFAQVSFGPKIGVGYSTIKETKSPPGSIALDSKYAFTPQIGVMAKFQIGKVFAINPELLFNQRAMKIDQSFFGTTFKGSFRVSYIELPINLALGGKVGGGRLEGFFGPAFALGLGGKSKTESSGFGVSKTTNSTIMAKKDPNAINDDNSYINPLNVSLNFGVNYIFESGLLLQAGYNLGLTNMNAHNSDSSIESKRNEQVIKSSSFNLAVGFLFGGK